MLVSIIYLLIVVLLLVSMWKVYEKAGRQGWEGIIPIYNLYVMLQIINRPWWWLLIMIFVPIANIIFSIIALKEFLEKLPLISPFVPMISNVREPEVNAHIFRSITAPSSISIVTT